VHQGQSFVTPFSRNRCRSQSLHQVKPSRVSACLQEVEYSEEPGKLYYFRYPIAGGGPDDFLPVATTRPETVLGDTAVAVHPEDERYKKFVGKNAVVPMSGGREIPVIADEVSRNLWLRFPRIPNHVRPTAGTGAALLSDFFVKKGLAAIRTEKNGLEVLQPLACA
jgi:hypothetical protein